MGPAVSRLQSYWEETAYFLPLSNNKYLQQKFKSKERDFIYYNKTRICFSFKQKLHLIFFQKTFKKFVKNIWSFTKYSFPRGCRLTKLNYFFCAELLISEIKIMAARGRTKSSLPSKLLRWYLFCKVQFFYFAITLN